MSDVWNVPSGAAGDGRPTAAALAPDVSDPMAVARETFADFQRHWAGYLTVGIAYLGVAFGAIAVALVALAVGFVPGMLVDDDAIAAIGAGIGMLLYVGVILVIAFALIPLMTASLIRATADQLDGGPQISAASLFGRVKPNVGRIVGYYALSQLAVMVGVLLLYIPGLIAAAIGIFATPIVALEPETGAVAALSHGFSHARRHPSWHVIVWLVLIAILIGLEFTIVGLVVAWPVMITYQTIAYRKAFGSLGAARALEGVTAS
ncbi:MAG: hypothetical protein ABMB14_33890 [Myxococcota bacterium]